MKIKRLAAKAALVLGSGLAFAIIEAAPRYLR